MVDRFAEILRGISGHGTNGQALDKPHLSPARKEPSSKLARVRGEKEKLLQQMQQLPRNQWEDFLQVNNFAQMRRGKELSWVYVPELEEVNLRSSEHPYLFSDPYRAYFANEASKRRQQRQDR